MRKTYVHFPPSIPGVWLIVNVFLKIVLQSTVKLANRVP